MLSLDTHYWRGYCNCQNELSLATPKCTASHSAMIFLVCRAVFAAFKTSKAISFFPRRLNYNKLYWSDDRDTQQRKSTKTHSLVPTNSICLLLGLNNKAKSTTSIIIIVADSKYHKSYFRSKKLASKCVNHDDKMLRQKCVNHEQVMH